MIGGSSTEGKLVAARCSINASIAAIFEFIADPSHQPEWDGNKNLREAASGQRVHRVGDIFSMTLSHGGMRLNQVVEFQEGSLIAWAPYELGEVPPGHLWRWQLRGLNAETSELIHSYDWSALPDPARIERAKSTTWSNLYESLLRLKALVETHQAGPEGCPPKRKG